MNKKIVIRCLLISVVLLILIIVGSALAFSAFFQSLQGRCGLGC